MRHATWTTHIAARALLHSPDLLFLDEPTAGLDPANARRIAGLIRQWFLAIFPTFWPAELFWHITGGGSGAWFIFTAGLAYQSILVALVARRFETIMHR